MTIKLGIVMDPIEGIAFKKDTSLALLDAAQRKGWELYYMEQGDLALNQGRAMGRMAPLKVEMNPENWFERGEYEWRPLSEKPRHLITNIFTALTFLSAQRVKAR